MFKDWSWQKWMGKGTVLILAVVGEIWLFVEGEPSWWPAIGALLTLLGQWAIAAVPQKEIE